MGFGFRKSLKIAKGVRLNLSKSGVGLSYGVKGFRISHNQRGTYLNAGGSGFYYRKKLDAKQRNSDTNFDYENNENDSYSEDNLLLKNVSGDYEYYIDKKDEWLLKNVIKYFEIKSKLGCLGSLTFIAGFFCPIFWLVNIAYMIYCKKNKKNILIEIPNDKLLQDATNIFNNISDNSVLYNAANNNELKYGQGILKGLLTSYVPYIELEEFKLYFINTGILMWDKNTIFVVPYKEIELNIEETESFVINPPEYAVILEQTYEHVNKNGTPNKKYKINRKIDKIKTWVITIKSNDYIFISLAFFDETNARKIFDTINQLTSNAETLKSA